MEPGSPADIGPEPARQGSFASRWLVSGAVILLAGGRISGNGTAKNRHEADWVTTP